MTKVERFTLIAAILGSGIVALDSTVVNIALPTIARTLHGGYSSLQWIVDGYLLTLSSLMLMAGSLGDIYGQKRIFELGVAGFGVTSLLCGLAPSTDLLTLGRLLQGVFGALLVPSSLAVINTTFSSAGRGRAIGTWTAYGGIFVAIGPVIGGLLINLSWRLIFLVNIPLAIACLFVIRQCVVDPKSTTTSRSIDYVGGLLAAAGLGAATYGLIDGPAQNWRPQTVGALALGIIMLAAFVVYERFATHPMLPLHLFGSRNFTAANLATLAMYAALGGAIFSVILYLQSAIGYVPLAAGLTFLPVTVLMFLFASKAGSLSGRFGPRFFMSAGPITASFSFLLMLRVTPTTSNYLLYVLPATLVFGIGLVLTVAPLTNTVMSSVDRSHSGIASAVNNAISRIAGLLIIAFLGIIVAAQTTQSIDASGVSLSAPAVSVVHVAIASGTKHGELAALPINERTAVASIVASSQRSIFTQSMLVDAILAFLAGIISLILVVNPRNQP